MPAPFLIATIGVPALLLVARLTAWALLRRRRNPRPGYLDLTTTTAPPRARKEPT